MIAALGLILTSPAATGVTLGQLAPPAAPNNCTGAQKLDILQSAISSGNSYVVGSEGGIVSWKLTSWTTQANLTAGQSWKMKIFRKVGEPSTYQVVGSDGPRPLMAGLMNSFPANVTVKPGDILGINWQAAGQSACAFNAAAGGGNLIRNAFGDLADGSSGGMIDGAATFGTVSRLNITADLEPTNTFSLGAVKRNTKRGTATLTADVPNPGKLTVFGKGVGTASSATAVVSKKVSAPGKVKLVIKAKGKKKSKLNEDGKVKLKPKVEFTPTGGLPATVKKKLKLKKDV